MGTAGATQSLRGLEADTEKAGKMAMTRTWRRRWRSLSGFVLPSQRWQKSKSDWISMAGDMGYYNGIVFRGYRRGVPEPVSRASTIL